ncbi:PREDICTED: T-lymphocyte activation antigen CD86 [Chrysochloris asiatica]|uniref:T-lymphocyte activation antigen CD86 n=1 Tax=Chrysochloris asiatica TaxID=185453 RepID=A0A9B0TQA5_CHRAS|nr:PREDICTED: T-lymphocyte activation antigen CD86 [Chrysochloris asiatica]
MAFGTMLGKGCSRRDNMGLWRLGHEKHCNFLFTLFFDVLLGDVSYHVVERGTQVDKLKHLANAGKELRTPTNSQIEANCCILDGLLQAFKTSGAAATIKTVAYFNETAHLPCQFINSQNLSLDKLVVFWQNQKMLVLYELYEGKEKADNVALKYKDRHIRFDKENLILHLHNVEIKDQGIYECVIHHKSPQGLKHLLKTTAKLSVIANFSQPKIMQDSNSTDKSYNNLTCSSTQGYPLPKKMYFLVESENSTTTYFAVMQKSQDNVSERYNVSINFYYPGLHNTTNMTILCVLCVADVQSLQSQTAEMCLQSKPYVTAPKSPETHQISNDHKHWIAGILTVIIVGMMVGVLAQWKRKKKQPDLSYEFHECEIALLDDFNEQKFILSHFRRLEV